jgi:putative hemolysin
VATHIIDELIEERAPRLAGSPLWPLIKPLLHALLNYDQARVMVDAAAPMSGADAMAYVDALLDLNVTVSGTGHIPKNGAVIFAANHPTGIADGFALYDAIMPARPDTVFYANADAKRVVPRLDEAIIPVEWIEAKRTRDKTRMVLQRTREVLDAGRALAIFPAGRISRWQGTRLTDPPWASTPLALARRHNAPVVPVQMTGPASILFRLLDKVSAELRDITLFHEMLNKRGRRFTVSFGPPIAADDLPADIETLKAQVEAGRW